MQFQQLYIFYLKSCFYTLYYYYLHIVEIGKIVYKCQLLLRIELADRWLSAST